MTKILRLLVIIIIGGSIISCAEPFIGGSKINNTLYQDFAQFIKQPEEGLFILRCTGNDNSMPAAPFALLDRYIKQSDFCVIGKKIITEDKPFFPPDEDPMERIRLRQGNIKVCSIIYGNPASEQIPFSYRYGNIVFSFGGPASPWTLFFPAEARLFIPRPWENSNVLDTTTVVLGKGNGQNSSILMGIWSAWELVSPQAIKAIKEMQNLGAEEFKRRENDLLLNSSNQEILAYLFRNRLSGSDTNGVIEMIRVLSAEQADTTQRRFLSYGFALYTLYEFTDEIQPNANIDKLNDAQRQALIDIAAKKLSEITSPQEGLKYLKLIGLFTYSPRLLSAGGWTDEDHKQFESVAPIHSRLFDKAPALKDNLKKITDSLSDRFKDDPDYPEWQKWVNKIFPADNK